MLEQEQMTAEQRELAQQETPDINQQDNMQDSSADDFFNQLINSTDSPNFSEAFDNPITQQTQQTDADGKLLAGRYKSVDELEKGYKHWQSEAYKRDNKLKEMEEELGALREIKEAIATDKELAQRLMNKFQGSETQTIQQNVSNGLQEPKRPDNFNEYEMNDPSTPSGKWAQEMQQYQQRKLIREELNHISESQRQQQLAEAQKQQMQNLYVNLAQQYGEEEARKRIEFLRSPKNVTPEALIALYDILNGRQIPQANIKRDLMNSMRPQYPVSVANGMGVQNGRVDNRSPEDILWGSIMDTEKQNNIFG